MMTKDRRREQGIVSIFVVIFAALTLTVITIGFIRTMIQEQQRSTDNDLSSSAYDSAVAGVEDGKRVIQKCTEGDIAACNSIAAQACNTVSAAGVTSSVGGETLIRAEGSADISLNQAYTCVKIDMETEDVTINLQQDKSVLVPLKASGAFEKIRIRWMHRNTGDGSYIGGDTSAIVSPTGVGVTSLPPEAGWNSSAASLLRVQTVLPDTDMIHLADLDSRFVSTVFLRPANVTGTSYAATDTGPIVGVVGERAAGNAATTTTGPTPVPCSQAEYQANGYACLATLGSAAPHIIPAGSGVAYIRLTSLYRDTSAKIELLDGANNVVAFDGVQPMIDSTGRASNVFRRIASRVSLSMNTTGYPEYGIDITGSLCKNYYITVNSGDAGPSPATCSPKP